MKKFGAIVLAASLSFGMLATSAQETNAAANYQVKKVAYSKEYKRDDGTAYFTVKGKFPQIKNDTDAAKKINQALTKEKNSLINQWKKNAKEYKNEIKKETGLACFFLYTVKRKIQLLTISVLSIQKGDC